MTGALQGYTLRTLEMGSKTITDLRRGYYRSEDSDCFGCSPTQPHAATPVSIEVLSALLVNLSCNTASCRFVRVQYFTATSLPLLMGRSM